MFSVCLSTGGPWSSAKSGGRSGSEVRWGGDVCLCVRSVWVWGHTIGTFLIFFFQKKSFWGLFLGTGSQPASQPGSEP